MLLFVLKSYHLSPEKTWATKNSFNECMGLGMGPGKKKRGAIRKQEGDLGEKGYEGRVGKGEHLVCTCKWWDRLLGLTLKGGGKAILS